MQKKSRIQIRLLVYGQFVKQINQIRLAFVNFRVEHITQPIAEQVNHQHQQYQHCARKGGDPPSARENISKADADQ